MLSLNELRYLCIESMKSKPTIRSLILTAIKFDTKELESFFYFAGYSLQKFKESIEEIEEMKDNENMGLIDIIKSEASPNILHLIKWYYLNNIGLKNKIERDGIVLADFLSYLETKIHLSDTKAILPDKSVSGNPLFHISRERYN